MQGDLCSFNCFIFENIANEPWVCRTKSYLKTGHGPCKNSKIRSIPSCLMKAQDKQQGQKHLENQRETNRNQICWQRHFKWDERR